MTRNTFGYVLLFSGVVLALYYRTFDFAWCYDDYPVIVLNQDVRSFSDFLTNANPGRPLRELSYLLDHALFGLNPGGWRIQHLFWHALNGFMLFALARQLDLSDRVAATAALIFLVHPLQVEVAANLSHRKDSLALALCLLAMSAYLRAFASPYQLGWRIAALSLWGVALAAKENALVLPLAAMLYEWQFVPKERRFLLRIPGGRFIWPAGMAAGLAIWVQLQGGWSAFRAQAFVLLEKIEYVDTPTLGTFARALLKSWSFMAVRIVWPTDLAVEYVYPVPSGWLDPWVIAGACFPVTLLGLTWYAISRRDRHVAFWSGWMLLFWLPTSNLWPMVYFAADRYYYAFVAGAGMVVALVLDRVCPPGRTLLFVGATSLLISLLAIVSWQQVSYWQNDEMLTRHALEVSPKSAALHNDLGLMAENRGEISAAIGLYRQAIALHPHYGAAHFNLGQLYERTGLFEQALPHYRRFLDDDSPAYQETIEELIERLKRERHIDLRGSK